MSVKVARIGLAALAVAALFAGASGPSAAQGEAAPAPAADAAKLAKGRELFDTFSCATCHALADAGATGHIGPALDGAKGLTEAFVTERVSKGQGGMPAFGDQMSPDEIAAIAAYVSQAAAK